MTEHLVEMVHCNIEMMTCLLIPNCLIWGVVYPACLIGKLRPSVAYYCHESPLVQNHFVREKVESGVVYIIYVPTNDNIADVFTKALPKPKHQKFRENLGMLAA